MRTRKTATRNVPGLWRKGQQHVQCCRNQHQTVAHTASNRDHRWRPRMKGKDRRTSTDSLNRDVHTKTATPNSPMRWNEVEQHQHCISNHIAHKQSHQMTSARGERDPRKECRTDATAKARTKRGRADARRAHSHAPLACALQLHNEHQNGPAASLEHRRRHDLEEGGGTIGRGPIRTKTARGAAT